VLAIATYVDFGVFRYGTYLNEWDFYHYYLGTKYAHELGYTNLYGATLAADQEGGLRYHNPRIRDLGTAQLRNVGEVAAESAHYRGRFSDARVGTSSSPMSPGSKCSSPRIAGACSWRTMATTARRPGRSWWVVLSPATCRCAIPSAGGSCWPWILCCYLRPQLPWRGRLGCALHS